MPKLTIGIAAVLACAFAASVARAEPPDSAGKVSEIVTRPVYSGKHIVRIHFSSYTQDRFGCLQNLGYIEANDATPYLDGKGLDRLLALATMALVTGMTLGMDSPGDGPCVNANMFRLIRD
jgi:hypothetical protein